jgi:tetratricopeptide (TPR) repeat protein
MERPEYFSRDKIKQEIARLEYNPESLDALHEDAVRCIKSKQYEECLYILNNIAELYEPTSQLYLNKALCNYHLGYIEDAMDCCRDSLELEPDNENATTLLSKLQERLDKLRKYTMGIYS